MDYPKSLPGVNLRNGKFTDGNAQTGELPSRDTAIWANSVTDELLNVINSAGLTPTEGVNDQLKQALLAKYAQLAGANFTGPVSGPTPQTGDNSTQLATTAFVSARTGTAGDLSFRNKIINGEMTISQRGTSFVNPANYTLDRWQVFYDGTAGSFTVSQQVLSAGLIPGDPVNFLRWDQTVAGSGSTSRWISQRVEGVRALAGGKVTVSFYAKLSAATSINVKLEQIFGSGGSSSVPTASQTVAIGTGWAKYALTFDLPSVAGKTIGANDCVILAFQLSPTSVFTFDLTSVQLEAGSCATPFEQRPMQIELALCQRYFETGIVSFRWDAPLASNATVGTTCAFSARKRIAPAVVMTNTNTAQFTILSAESVSAGGMCPSFGFVNWNVSVTRIAAFPYAADAEL
ncbi:hypothetical protein R0381_002558 [Jeongeupia wiesaeckerbachi]|uniref:hypothetical protein n=1 Tax=Jeongeupia wiesaeckerbachi TaxID=3051218 RepID=UPI003D8047D1